MDYASARDWAHRRSENGNGSSGRVKRAELLATEIEAEILRRGWPVGEVLGSESELLDRYQVSRAVLREAIRLLEHHFIAKMRRGRAGGLVICAPNPGVVANAVALFLRYRQVRPADLFEVRQALEMTAVRLAAQRATEDEVARIRKLAQHPDMSPVALAKRYEEFHVAIGDCSGNPAVALFVQVIAILTETLVDHSAAEPVAEEVTVAHLAIAEAIAAGDAALAQRRLLRHFEAAAAAGFR